MKAPQLIHNCIFCSNIIDFRFYTKSLRNMGLPLCRPCEGIFQRKTRTASSTAIKLYIELIRQGINAELEYYDGYKTVDIVIHSARIHLEVDGLQHQTRTQYAISDLKRTYYSLADGYITIRIPNCLVDEALVQTLYHIGKLVHLRSSNILPESTSNQGTG